MPEAWLDQGRGLEAVTATLLCNAGLCFRCGPSAVLVDALNQPFRSFKGIPDETARRIIAGEAPYEHIDGLFYTHLHPDHYDKARNDGFLARHPGVKTFIPTSETPDYGTIKAGEFTLEYQTLEHIPCDYERVKHYVLLLTVENCTVYLAGDAALDPAAHRAFLAGRRVDYAFFNAIYLSYRETRALLRETREGTFIYHMPESETDKSGIYRKVARNYERYHDELHNIVTVMKYPTELNLQSKGER